MPADILRIYPRGNKKYKKEKEATRCPASLVTGIHLDISKEKKSCGGGWPTAQYPPPFVTERKILSKASRSGITLIYKMLIQAAKVGA